jgi:NADH:ubiquinone oxidoreductase subunit F (NADH-binding)
MLDTPLEFDAMREAGAGLGSGGFIVYDDTTCMVRVAHLFSRFLYVESCGQCTSCKFGTNQATYHLHRIEIGAGQARDIEETLVGAALAPNGNRCFLPVEHSLCIPSIIRNFKHEFEKHFGRGCRNCREIIMPKLVDYDEEKHAFRYAKRLRAA